MLDLCLTVVAFVSTSKPCNITAIRRPLRPGQTRTVSCLVSENNFRFSHETFRMVMNAYNELGNASSDFVLSTYEIGEYGGAVRYRCPVSLGRGTCARLLTAGPRSLSDRWAGGRRATPHRTGRHYGKRH